MINLRIDGSASWSSRPNSSCLLALTFDKGPGAPGRTYSQPPLASVCQPSETKSRRTRAAATRRSPAGVSAAGRRSSWARPTSASGAGRDPISTSSAYDSPLSSSVGENNRQLPVRTSSATASACLLACPPDPNCVTNLVRCPYWLRTDAGRPINLAALSMRTFAALRQSETLRPPQESRFELDPRSNHSSPHLGRAFGNACKVEQNTHLGRKWCPGQAEQRNDWLVGASRD